MVVGPLSPPMAGVERAVANLATLLQLEVVDTQIHTTLEAKGSVDLRSVATLMRQTVEVFERVRHGRPSLAIVAEGLSRRMGAFIALSDSDRMALGREVHHRIRTLCDPAAAAGLWRSVLAETTRD